MPLQARISQQSSDPLQPNSTITISNDSGSFILPKGMILNLINCSNVSCTSNGGDNALSLSGCSGVTITGFIGGTIRLENCTNINITTTKDCKLSISGQTGQSLNLTNTDANLISCTVESATLNNCVLHSINSQYQRLSVSGGQTYSEGDQITGSFTLQNQAEIIAIRAQLSSSLTLTDSKGTFQKCVSIGDVTVNSSRFEDISGQYLSFTASQATSLLNLTSTEIQNDLNVTDSQINLNNVQVLGSITCSNAVLQATQLQATGSTSLTSGSAILNNCTFTGTLVLNQLATALQNSTIAGTITINAGSLDSYKNTYSGALIQTGGNISSQNDKVQDMTFTGLIAENTFWKLTAVNLNLVGADISNQVSIENSTVANTSINNFSDVYVSGGGGNLDVALCTQVQVESFVGGVILTSVSLAVCTGLTALIASLSNIIADLSTIASAINCNLTLYSCTVTTATTCNIRATNSSVVGIDCVIDAINSTVTNSGLTTGTGFAPNTQGGYVLFDGANLTLGSTLGITNINSLTNMVLTAGATLDLISTGVLNIDGGTSVVINTPSLILP